MLNTKVHKRVYLTKKTDGAYIYKMYKVKNLTLYENIIAPLVDHKKPVSSHIFRKGEFCFTVHIQEVDARLV